MDALQEDVLKKLAAASSRGRLSHAYLLVGPANKLDLALFMAQTICCTGQGDYPCGDCRSCRRIQSYSHPDVTLWFWEQIGKQIDEVRLIQSEAALAPREAPRRIYILADAHRMNSASANCLLKTLEEAPGHAMFILMAPNVFTLLPTIVSRCQKLYVPEIARDIDEAAPWDGDTGSLQLLFKSECREIMKILIERWPVGLGELEGMLGSSRDERLERERKLLVGLFSSLPDQDLFTLTCWADSLSMAIREHGKFVSALQNWELVNEEINRRDLSVDEMINAISNASPKKENRRGSKKEARRSPMKEARRSQRREVEELIRFSGHVVSDRVHKGYLPVSKMQKWMDSFTEIRQWIARNLEITLILETSFFRLAKIFKLENSRTIRVQGV